MSEHKVTIDWQRKTDSFAIKEYNRAHTWDFGEGNVVNASAAVGYQGDADCVDPEQAFVASIASCHMLTFLAVASQQNFVIDQYQDNTVGSLGKNAAGKMAVTVVDLYPNITFSGDNQPDKAQLEQLHHKAHQFCFIANSVSCEIKVH